MSARGVDLVLLALVTACSAEPVGVARLSLGTAAVPDGVDRVTLTLSAPDIAPRVVPVDLDTLAFDVAVPAGEARTLTILAETDADGAWLPWYWGTASFAIEEGEVRDVILPAVPAARIHPLVLLDGALVEGALVTTTLLEPPPDLPASFEDVSVRADGAERTLPAGDVTVAATLQDGLARWTTRPGGVPLALGQGDVVTVPLALDPAVQVPGVDHLELALGELRVGQAGDIVVRALDSAGDLVESFDGVVELSASDAGALSLPAPYGFDPGIDRGAHVYAGGAVGLAAGLGIRVRASVRGDPTVLGERSVDVLAVDEVVGGAVALAIEVLGPVQGGLLARPVDLRVTALDAAGRVATGYTGRVTFADSDRLLLSVPADTSFTEEDAGIVRIDGGLLSLVQTGLATLRARDVADPSIAGELTIPIE